MSSDSPINPRTDEGRGSVSTWLDHLRAGDCSAAEPLWNEYYPRLVGLARKQIGKFPLAGADEEDAAVSAFATFWRRLREGQFQQITDRDSLWRMLGTITVRKLRRYQSIEQAAKRGGNIANVSQAVDWEQIAALDTSDLDQEAYNLIELLHDDQLATIATLRLMGHTVDEVASFLQLSRRTLERKLKLIRTIWLEGFGT